MKTDRAEAPAGGRSWQFSLSGLFVFMTACGVYCWMLAPLAPLMFRRPYGSRPVSSWMVAIPVAWILLAVFYRRYCPRQALVVHGFFPVLGVIPCAFSLGILIHTSVVNGFSLVDAWRAFELRDNPALLSLYAACAVSTFVSFPMALVMWAYRAAVLRGAAGRTVSLEVGRKSP